MRSRAARRVSHSPGCTMNLTCPGFGRRVANGGLGTGDTGGGVVRRRTVPAGRPGSVESGSLLSVSSPKLLAGFARSAFFAGRRGC
jgi:hypothetical protein